ncbi:MAG: NAD(P)H-dependent oxidoreductase subunit E [Actinomycetota bacterium]|nr:NAD(P)H-dependent oxidoreductase subunit E [Actinomycetota bacterium]
METLCSCEEKEVVAGVVGKYAGRDGVLVDVLHDVQSAFKYLPDSVLRRISTELDVPLSRVYGVATFYSGFRFTPPPENEIKVCTGTACHVRGAPGVLKGFEDALGIAAGERTSDDWVGLDTVSCVGCCALAPALVVNGEVRRGKDAAKVIESLKPIPECDEDVA